MEATQKLQGRAAAPTPSGKKVKGNDREMAMEETMEETRRRLNAWRRLEVCRAWVKGKTFNDMGGDCALSTTTTVGDGEILRIRGQDDLDHPVLDRGGQANGATTVTDRHFVMTGTSNLALVNLKLIGAWVGNVDTGCLTCGYCAKTVSVIGVVFK